jgi:radical SAM superfamily enzyme YgiQ (UPF0313 family)
MSADILLINVPITMAERYGSFASVGSQTPPLGLCYIASSVQSKGYRAVILDAPALNLNIEQTIAEIKNCTPSVIGLTASTVSIINAHELASTIKKSRINAPVVVGGAHVSSLPEQTLAEFPSFDIGVVNEGEYTTIDIIDAVKNNTPLHDIPGIVYRAGNDIIRSPFRPHIQNLDDLPYPAWDLLPPLNTFYKPSPHSCLKQPSSSLVTSRGCNGTCTFCARPFMGERYRGHSAEYTLEMIDILVKNYGIKDIMFYDDNFLLDRKRVLRICEGLLRKPYRISWSCLARTEAFPDDFLKLIKSSGCWQIAFGIESGDQQILDNIKKRTTIQKIKDVVRKTNAAGIHSRGYFMIGCPGETPETIQKTTRFIKECGVKDFHVTYCTPMPGAELYSTAAQHGSFEQSWKKLGFWEPVFIPNGMTKEQLIDSHQRMYRKFYLRPSVICRYLFRSITNPNRLYFLLQAGWSVAGYTLKGYVGKKCKGLIQRRTTTPRSTS